MSIHSRGAVSLVLDHLEIQRESGVPVMHWFSGTPWELERAVELGCWFSVGPAMLQSERGRHLTSMMPRDRVLTETDGPIASRAGTPLMPWDVTVAEVVLGELWEIPTTAVQRQLFQNLRHLVVN